MNIQQRIPLESIESIVKDPKKYRKMMLILQQTLYDLGYPQSAKMLQNESGLKLMKQNLQRNDFQAAIRVIDGIDNKNSLNKDTQNVRVNDNHDNHGDNNHEASTKIQTSALVQTKNMIYETYCMQKIINQQFQGAMEIISENIQNESKKQFLCEALVLGNHEMTGSDLSRKKEQIFKYCLSQYQQIGERQIQKVIQSYTQHQGQHNRELKNLMCSSKKFPPMKILSIQGQSHIKSGITHLKMNLELDQLILVDESKDSQELLLFKIHRKNWKYQKQISESGHLSLKLKYPIFLLITKKPVEFIYKAKKQSVQSLAWNNNNQFPLIALASFSVIQLVNRHLETLHRIQSHNKIQKFLHLQFNPISDLLYCSGYFQYISVFDCQGSQIMSIYPYPKTRKFLFYQSSIIGVSLVSNRIYKHSVDEQILLKQKQLDEGVMAMDLCVDVNRKFVGVSSLLYVYVLSPESLQILGKTSAPANPNKLVIQVKFYGEFLIALCKNFTSYQLVQDRLSQKQNALIISKNKQWPGEGTFSIQDQLMISGIKQLICWEEGNLQCSIDSDSDLQQQDQIRMVDIEDDDDDQDQDMMSESQESELDYDNMAEESDEEIEI